MSFNRRILKCYFAKKLVKPVHTCLYTSVGRTPGFHAKGRGFELWVCHIFIRKLPSTSFSYRGIVDCLQKKRVSFGYDMPRKAFGVSSRRYISKILLRRRKLNNTHARTYTVIMYNYCNSSLNNYTKIACKTTLVINAPS